MKMRDAVVDRAEVVWLANDFERFEITFTEEWCADSKRILKVGMGSYGNFDKGEEGQVALHIALGSICANLREIAWRRYTSGGFLPLASLYGRGEYDKGLLLYTEGFSVVDFLIGRGGSRWFAEFVKYLTNESQGVGEALRAFYGYASLRELQEDWLRYVETGQDRSRTRRVYFRYDEEKKE